jgi:hypothetical protein
VTIGPTRTERVYYDPLPESEADETWWSRYKAQLGDLTPTAQAAVEADSRYVVSRGIFGAGEPNPTVWPDNRVRTGLVMGSVQSGKTASMLGVSALAIDQGVDIVIVLAGTRLSLWRQTYERLTEQLDVGSGARRLAGRLLCPRSMTASSGSQNLSSIYGVQIPALKRRLDNHNPLIVVAMKQTDHLRALGESLRRNVFHVVEGLGRTVHMLVLDDEVDDGSVLDARAEEGQDPVYGNLKQLPRTIANLWDPVTGSPDNFYTTYIGYTATPQANLLQEDHNPLAPRDFLISLRTPLDAGANVDVDAPGNLEAPRTSTYPEPKGHRYFYTGGEVFYRRGDRATLCVETTDTPEDLADAVRAFLVAGAIRLHRSGKLGPNSAANRRFDTREDADTLVARPHSMLYHPSPQIEKHFQVAEDLLIWAGMADRETARSHLQSGDARLPAELVATLDSEPAKWIKWLDAYMNSSIALEVEFNIPVPPLFPDWPDLKKLLAGEVIPGTRVTVNRPRFDAAPV